MRPLVGALALFTVATIGCSVAESIGWLVLAVPFRA